MGWALRGTGIDVKSGVVGKASSSACSHGGAAKRGGHSGGVRGERPRATRATRDHALLRLACWQKRGGPFGARRERATAPRTQAMDVRGTA